MASSDDLENPALIDEGPTRVRLGKPLAPLILVHDGGGTTFSYHCLEPINRPLYGIQNVHLHQGGYWEGGVPEIASHYIGLLAKILPHGGDILLGGWSFGGLLSLEMAHQLATAPPQAPGKPRFRVLGMIFIDSVYPRHLLLPEEGADSLPEAAIPEKPIVKSAEELRAMKLREKVDLNMTHARMMARRWVLPRWETEKGGGGVSIPPTILLRAKENVQSESHVFVDHSRAYRMLGWEKYQEQLGRTFIEEVVDVEGHHFSLFEFDKIPEISEQIRAAADTLDEPVF